jgi:Amt family ammonium transporter
MKKMHLFLALILTVFAANLGAQEAVSGDNLAMEVAAISEALDFVWLLLAAALVFFMQAGFAMVETGLTRAKNAGNIIMKNLMDFSAGALAFWAVGWAVMYGGSRGGLFGLDQFFLAGADPAVFRDWMFQVVFAATAATIVSGAMAERTKFSSYLVYSVFITALIYPVAGHWIWNGGGWLAQLGFHDFAGSTVVHSVGGWAALVGAAVLGPRRGKYTTRPSDGKCERRAIPGHNMPLAALGVFILWFGWYGFNCGSTLSGNDTSMALVAVTTTLGASAGAIAAMATSWIMFGKPDPSMSLNGALAGLVGITAPTAVVSPAGAIIIGFVAGILVIFSAEFFDTKLKIDDPVGAISVHGVGGVWGTLAVGLFSTNPDMLGLFYGGGFRQLGIQALGVVAVFYWTAATSFILFKTVAKTIGLRVKGEDEMKGLDLGEHAMEAYSGFQIFSNM